MKAPLSRTFRLTIDGKLVDTDSTFEVSNPASGEVLCAAPHADTQNLDAAVHAAFAAFHVWASTPWRQRRDYIHQFADEVQRQADDLAQLLTLEQGKPLNSMARPEIALAVSWLKEIADLRLADEIRHDTPARTVAVKHVPLGVAAAITPWNYPVLLAARKIASALITGNTVVLKPSPHTPLCTLVLGEIACDTLPPGVLNVVSGREPLGRDLVGHPLVRKISFTGSTSTGREILARSARDLKRVTLELGGNDAAIVLPGADWPSIVEKIFWAAFGNSGQWCVAIKRLYVPSSIFSAFMTELCQYAAKIVVGDGLSADSRLGPVQNPLQYEKLRTLIKELEEDGAKIAFRGAIPQTEGYFLPVTIVADPAESSRIVQEEQFGPILPVLSYTSVDDAVRRANNSNMGLGASVWGPDELARRIGDELDTGLVWINEIHTEGVSTPFGGHKHSGLGVENGVEGLREYTNIKVISTAK